MQQWGYHAKPNPQEIMLRTWGNFEMMSNQVKLTPRVEPQGKKKTQNRLIQDMMLEKNDLENGGGIGVRRTTATCIAKNGGRKPELQ